MTDDILRPTWEDPLIVGENGIWQTIRDAERDPASHKMVVAEIAHIEAERKAAAKDADFRRRNLKKSGNTPSGEMRLMGNMPEDIYIANPHLYGPDVPPEQQKRNFRRFFAEQGQYRVGVL